MHDIREIIDHTLNYIEENIYEKICLDSIASCTGLSKYYLHRIFKAYTGQTVISYAQSRKLSLSINDLVYTNKRIIDIALDYGFEYEQSYIRAFTKKFGYTPLKTRNETVPLVITEKLNANDMTVENNAIICKPSFVFMRRMHLVGVRHLLTKNSGVYANNLAKDFYYLKRNQINNIRNPHIYFGYTDLRQNEDGFFKYIPSIEVSSLHDIPKDMIGISIPPHKYISFKYIGLMNHNDLNYSHVGRLVSKICSTYILSSGYKLADSYRFEYIDTKISKDNYCELNLYQPITHITAPILVSPACDIKKL